MKKTILIILAIIILIALFFWLKPQAVSKEAEESTENNSVEQTIDSGVKKFGIEIQNKKLVFGPETITVTEGDTVQLTVLSDVDEELHIHGYDTSMELIKGQPQSVTFVADVAGRFEFELEKSHTSVGVIEVLPR